MAFDPITFDAVSQLSRKITSGASISKMFLASGTFTAPFDGVAVIRVMGAGGGGASSYSGGSVKATGGYSGSWALKVLRMAAGETLTFSIGAGGAGKSGGSAGAGTAGGATSVTYASTAHSTPGGPGGESAATPTNANGPASSDSWFDVKVASVKPGVPPGVNQATGGAGVDILGQGGNATTSDSSAYSGGGGTGSASVGTTGGGALAGGLSINGKAPADPPDFVPALQDEWGLPFFGGSGGASNKAGANGGGGGSGSAGGIGGGGGGGYGGGGGGIGGGGGATSAASAAGKGGDGYAFVKFFSAS